MIAQLRRRHRQYWLVITVLVPLLALASWRSRQPPVTMSRIPPQLLVKP
jgi:hypothetical protein